MERKLISKKDVFIMVLLLIMAVILYIVPRLMTEQGTRAVITCDDKTVGAISLDKSGEYTYPELPDMVFTVSDGEVYVTESGCDDKTCIRTGGISRHGEAIICVPNKAAVTIEGTPDTDNLDVILK